MAKIIGLGAMVLLLAAAGCRHPDLSASAHNVTGGQEVSVDALDHRFSPRYVNLDSGKPITVKVHNSGLLTHTFTTNDPSADVVVGPQETKTVTFNPTKSTYFFCRFHESDGMKGSLCVRGQRCLAAAFP